MNVTHNNSGYPKRTDRRDQKNMRRLTDNLDKFAHEVLNQLTVINLSCFRLRIDTRADANGAILVELERIEKGISELTELLTTLPQETHAAATHEAESSAQEAPNKIAHGNNVVPFFTRNHLKR